MDIKDQTSREYFKMFYSAATHLNDLFDRLKLINDINSWEVKNHPIDFEVILSLVKQRLNRLENFSHIPIVEHMDSNASLHSDPFLIVTIFYNVLENSVRFQKGDDQKPVIVKITDRGANVMISFINNGNEIPKADQEHIFKMFSKAASPHQTIGLGLYIVKLCLNKISGTISLVRSDEWQTEFEVILPKPAFA